MTKTSLNPLMESLSRFSNVPVPFKNHFPLCPYVFAWLRGESEIIENEMLALLTFLFQRTVRKFHRKPLA